MATGGLLDQAGPGCALYGLVAAANDLCQAAVSGCWCVACPASGHQATPFSSSYSKQAQVLCRSVSCLCSRAPHFRWETMSTTQQSSRFIVQFCSSVLPISAAYHEVYRSAVQCSSTVCIILQQMSALYCSTVHCSVAWWDGTLHSFPSRWLVATLPVSYRPYSLTSIAILLSTTLHP